MHDFQHVLIDSRLGQRRPVEDLPRLERMLRGSDLIVTTIREGVLLGVARSITDHAYCCYLSDLAVVRLVQRSGIRRRLLEQTRTYLGPEVSLILSASPDAVDFYKRVGIPALANCFWYRQQF